MGMSDVSICGVVFMNLRYRHNVLKWAAVVLLAAVLQTTYAGEPMISPSPHWKNEIVFPYDSFCNIGFSANSVKWVKFTILLEPYDPTVVYFQNSRRYVFHYTFAAEVLDPFLGMSPQQFNAVSLFEENQQAILGTIILPPPAVSEGVTPIEPRVQEYGIEFVRQDPFTPEQIRDLFHIVKAQVAAPPDVQVFYFPTFEQQATALAHRDWFESQGIPLGSTARWARGNVGYSYGWAFGTVKFVPGDQINSAYFSGLLAPGDILLTDGIPADIPLVAGILSLAPSTPNSHVALLAKSQGVPFVFLALADYAERAQQLIGRRIIFTAYDDHYGTCEVRLIDVDAQIDEATAAQILQLKLPLPLHISPMASLGTIGISTEGLHPSDIQYVGGKAAHFGILRAAIPDNSPRAIGLTFDLWNGFLDQPLTPSDPLILQPGEHILFWADGEPGRGRLHTDFSLSRHGEAIGLFDVDGMTLLDKVEFGPQQRDVSYGRSVDGGDAWEFFLSPTPGQPNSGRQPIRGGLVINEFMAANRETIENPAQPGEYSDWIELYNASDRPIILDGMYLTDDLSRPTKWQIPLAISGGTLREEIARRLSSYDAWPPPDMAVLSQDLATIRNLFTNPSVTSFTPEARQAVIDVLSDPQHGFDPYSMLRFRSSTNVEDSEDFIGAGLYDSYGGCLADTLDGDEDGPCACDPNRSKRGVFRAIRRVFASFYNNNAYLERLRHGVNEAHAGMAIAVHHNFPDEIELANGVAHVAWKGPEASTRITLVTQQGAISITNPEDDSQPEVVIVSVPPSRSFALLPRDIQQASSRVPLGSTVMTWRADYTQLIDLLFRVSDEFGRTTGKTRYVLDIEYKKMAPGGQVIPDGGVVIKQVRQVPMSEQMQTAFLVNEPVRFEVFTGEVGVLDPTDVFADHRLKSRWTLETRNTVLDPNTLTESLYTQVRIEYLDGDRIRTISGSMQLLPSSEHTYDGKAAVDSWRLDDLENPRTVRLKTVNIPTAVPPGQRPIFTLTDFGTQGYNVPFKCLTLDVEYDKPVPSWNQRMTSSGVISDSVSALVTTRRNQVYLWPLLPPSPADVRQERTLTADGVSIHTVFYYPPLLEGQDMWGFVGGNTGPLKRWDRTVIEGLTSAPIVLTGYYSQTFRPEHHNLVEHFLFEPGIEPGIDSGILEELREKDIRFIQVILNNVGSAPSEILTHGFTDMPVRADGT